MTRWGSIAAAAALGIAIGAAGWIAAAQQAADAEGLTFLGEPVTAAQLALGQDVYAANCASCHGADLKGQPDWQIPDDNGILPAPPHDASGHTWHHGDAMLRDYIRLGGQAVLDDLADLSGHQVYACGAPVVVDAARAAYTAQRGLPPEEFYADAFTSEADNHGG